MMYMLICVRSLTSQQAQGKRSLFQFSGAEIEAIAEKEIRKQALAEQARSRDTVRLVSKVKALPSRNVLGKSSL